MLYNQKLSNSLILFEFLPILIFLLIAIILALIIVTLSYLLSVQNPETEKLSVYKCSFEFYEDIRNIFDVKFYLYIKSFSCTEKSKQCTIMLMIFRQLVF